MSDLPTNPKPGSRANGPQAPARAAKAAATRRRWINLGEVLAVAAVVISGLTLWNSWGDRRDREATQKVELQQSSARARLLVLTSSPVGEHELVLNPASGDQAVQSQIVSFPTALGVAPAQTTGKPRIEAAWFEHALKNARGAAGLPGDSRGDERLPVAITTRFLVGGEAHEDRAIYDIGYTISGHWLGGHSVALRGVSLVSRWENRAMHPALDTRWAELLHRR